MPVPGRQAAIRLYRGSLSGLGEERQADRDAVCLDAPWLARQRILPLMGEVRP